MDKNTWIKKADEARSRSLDPALSVTEHVRQDEKWKCYRYVAEGGNVPAALASAMAALRYPENLGGTYEIRLRAMIEVYKEALTKVGP